MKDDKTLNLSSINSFEIAWQSGKAPSLSDYLPDPSSDTYLGTLQELVIIDLEFGWKRFSAESSDIAEKPRLIEAYLIRFPALDEDPIIRRLVEEEFVIRHRYGDRPDPNHFVTRFPSLAELIEKLCNDHSEGSLRQATDNSIPNQSEPEIQDYSLIGEIGEGGMGSVYLAQQEHPVRRKVAVKVIRSGLDSKEVIARFEAERQALAMMDHQNIARVFDAGTTRQGQPFFAMEYVDGVPITNFCQSMKTSIPDRLRMFNDVCAAVQHAHQKGILHRDLKPSNVLIAEEDGKPIAKVIDFGLAKAIDSSELLTDKTLQTHVGQVLGTLKYMSPEQAATHESDVDTRADVYALGVILYELLAGETPLDESSLRDQGILSILEIIRDHEPVRPSVKLGNDSESQIVSTQRSTTSKALRQLLAGDLDWVVMKALEKDRERRYDSASSLADDVHRFLNDEPVNARPPSASYRLQKFARKNRGLLTTAMVSCLALVAATVISLAFAFHADQQRQLAETAREQEQRANKETQLALLKAKAATEEATRALAESEESRIKALTISDFMEEIFGFADPRIGGAQLTVVSALEYAVGQIDRVYHDYPGVRSVLMVKVANTLGTLGKTDQAIMLCEKAIEIRTAMGDDMEGIDVSLDLGAARGTLANLWRKAGNRERAYQIQSELLKELRAKNGTETQSSVLAFVNLVGYMDRDHDTRNTVAAAKEAWEQSKKVFGDVHEVTLDAASHLGKALVKDGNPQEAVELHELILTKLGDKQLGDSLTQTKLLGESHIAAGRTDEGISLLQKVLEDSRKSLGIHHLDTIQIHGLLAEHYIKTGDIDSGIELAQEEFRLCQDNLGPFHQLTISSRHNLGTFLTQVGKYQQASSIRHQTYDLLNESLGTKSLRTLEAANLLVNSLLHSGQLDEAIRRGEETLRLHREILDDNHAETVTAIDNLVFAYRNANRHADAIELSMRMLASATRTYETTDPVVLHSAKRLSKSYSQAASSQIPFEIDEESVEFITKQLPSDHADTMQAMFDLAETYSNRGNAQRAIQLHSQVLNLRRKHLGNRHADTLLSIGYLGMLYNQANDTVRSTPLCLEAYREIPNVYGSASQEFSGACIGLQTAYRMDGKHGKAVEIGNATLAAFRKELDETHPLVLGIKYWTAVCHCEAGQYDPAIAILREVVRDRTKILGLTASDTINALDMLANAYRSKDDYESAIKTIETIVDAQRKAYGDKDERVRDSIGSLAYLEELAGDYESAAKFNAMYAAPVTFSLNPNDLWSYQIVVARECHCLIESNQIDEAELKLAGLKVKSLLLPPSYLHFLLKSLEGKIKSRRKEYAAAEPLLIEGYEGLKEHQASIPDIHTMVLPNAARRLISLYSAVHKPEEVARWEKELHSLNSGGTSQSR